MLEGYKTKIAIGGWVLCQLVGFLQPELQPIMSILQETVFGPLGAWGIYSKVVRKDA